MSRSARLQELAWLFLKLGTIGFGGPAAHIAMLEDEVVRRRGWLSHEKFIDLVGATNLIPDRIRPKWRSTSDTPALDLRVSLWRARVSSSRQR